MSRKKQRGWKPVSHATIDNVKVGTRIRNNETGMEYRVVKVFGKDANGILQVEAQPLTPPPNTIEWTGDEWRLA